MSIYEKLVEATGLAYAGESATEYAKKAAQALQQLEEEVWNGLDPEIHDWYNTFAESYGEGGAEDDWVAPEVDGLQEEIDNYVAPEVPAKKEKKEKAPKEPKAPKEKKEKAPKPPKEKKEPVPSNSGTMRDIMAEAFDLSLDDLMTQLEEKGKVAKRASAQIVWFNAQKTMETIMAKGFFKDKAGNTYKIVKE